jgi:hypothetical protein
VSGAEKRDLNTNSTHLNDLQNRGPERNFPVEITAGLTDVARLYLRSRPYPSRGAIFRTALGRQTVLRQSFELSGESCTDAEVVENPLNGDANTAPMNLPLDAEVDHGLDVCPLILVCTWLITHMNSVAEYPRTDGSWRKSW